uniref:Uncharacterized protein n=1 Tax=Desertifilum tharense IPPAS B-1220 TaxID=1781255 RepID=A0ACD5GZH3_9CYAN
MGRWGDGELGVGGWGKKGSFRLTPHYFPHSAHCFAEASATELSTHFSPPSSSLGTRNFALHPPYSALSTFHSAL